MIKRYGTWRQNGIDFAKTISLLTEKVKMEICDNDRLYLYADVHILRGCYEEEMHMNIGVVWLLDVNAKCLINL